MTLSFFIAAATLFLSFGSPLAVKAAAATSKSARLGPACWFQYLPDFCWYPAASCLFETPVSGERYGHDGAQYAALARLNPSDPSAATCDEKSPVFAICAILICFVRPCWAACRQNVA